jgi:hypothetical protein
MLSRGSQLRGDAELFKGGRLNHRWGDPIAMDGKLFFDTYLSKDTAPPRYTTHESTHTSVPDDNAAPPPLPSRTNPTSCRGEVPKQPFVTVSQLKTHLGLLRAFKQLKNRVTDLEAHEDARNKLPPLAQELGPQERWTWFLELALERCVPCHSLAGPIFAEL